MTKQSGTNKFSHVQYVSQMCVYVHMCTHVCLMIYDVL